MVIFYSEWGMANRIGNSIILNKNLKKYPWLHDRILRHELKHNDDPAYNVKHDLESMKETRLIEWIIKTKFMLKYPKSLVQMSPVWFYKGRPYIDLTLVLVYLIIGSILYMRWYR